MRDSKLFIGREHELDTLTHMLSKACEGSAKLCLLSGEPGIGKTTLAQMLEQRAQAKNAVTVWGRCWEAGAAPAYWPWNNILRACKTALGGDELKQRITRACPLGELPEELRRVFDSGDVTTTADSRVASAHEGARLRVFEAIGNALRAFSEQQPVVIIFDDLHAADAGSMALLLFIVRELKDAKLMVLAAFRAAELEQNTELTELKSKISREGEELLLEGLNCGSSNDLYRKLSGQTLKPEEQTELSSVSGGNPLFLTELVRLRSAPGNYLPKALPKVLRDITEQRVNQLPQEVRNSLRVAATIGRDFSSRMLAAALRMRSTDLEKHLEYAKGAHIVEALEQGTVKTNSADWWFSHDFLRETLVSHLEHNERAEIHLTIAETFDKFRNELDIAEATIARHYYLAIPVIPAETAIDRLNSAAHTALTSGAYEEAGRLARYSLAAALDNNIDSPSAESLAQLSAGRADLALGDFKAAKKRFKLAFEAGHKAQSGTLSIRAALGYGTLVEIGRTGPELVEMFEQGLRLLGDQQPHLQCLALARLSQHLSQSTRLDDARRYAASARRTAASVADPLVKAQTLLFTLSALQSPDNVYERIDDAKQVIKLARAAGSKRVELMGHEELIRHGIEASEPLLAESSRASLASIAAELQNWIPTWLSMVHEAYKSALLADFEVAEKQAVAALEFGHANSNHDAWMMYFTHIHMVYWHQNTAAQALPTMEEMCRQAPGASPVHTGYLVVKAHAGGHNTMIGAELDRYVDDDFAEIDRDYFWLASMAYLTEVITFIRHKRSAEAVYSLLLPYESQHASILQATYLGSISLCLGQLAQCAGDIPSAKSHYEKAVTRERRIGAIAYECYARLGLVSTLIEDYGESTDANKVVNEQLNIVREVLQRKNIPRARTIIDELTASLNPETLTVEVQATTTSSVELWLEGDYWTIGTNGRRHRLRDSKGLQYLYQLITTPQRPVFAIELVQFSATPAANAYLDCEAVNSANPGSEGAGPVLDETANRQYRQRLDDIRSELLEAEANNDTGRIEQYRTEMDFLIQQLKSATGLAGRTRNTNSNSDRARSAVTKAIRTSIRKIYELEPEIGHYLQESIKTGNQCEYQPSLLKVINWNFIPTS